MINLHHKAQQTRVNTYQISGDIINRWSPRGMTGEELPEDTLTPLLEAGGYAPSAHNNQPWKFYYSSRGSQGFDRLLKTLVPFNQEWCKQASFLIVLVSSNLFEHNGKPNPTHSFDTGAAWEAFAVEGTKRNLVVHGMSGFDYEKAKEYLGLDENYTVECMIAVGKPSDEAEKEEVSLRKPTVDIAMKIV